MQPRMASVKCLSPVGFHRMAYTEWGDADNPAVLVCVHGLTRVGRDFDVIARALVPRWRVVCPDVVGRGRSDWLRDPKYYQVPQYAADMVALIARLGVEQVDWVGTSMGGLIGLSLAGQPGAPIRRLVLNDVGPRLDVAALTRIGDYVGRPLRFANLDQATDYIASISAPFKLRDRGQWRAITETALRRDGDAWVLHYDPAIGLPFKSVTADAAASGEAALWALYDRIACPTLVVRGAESDLLTRATADEMGQRGPRPRVVEIAGVGHAPMLMEDDQIRIVADFLNEAAT
jgi:pimeloyl-ACP methyl ester carboxylesterase